MHPKAGGASLLLVLLLAASPAGARGDSALQPHDPIVIDGNFDLLLPEFLSRNGVVRGTGTALDPYVIEGWHIRADGPALSINGTDVHILVQNVILEPASKPEMLRPSGIPLEIRNVKNLILRDVTVRDSLYYAPVKNSAVVFERLRSERSDIGFDASEIEIRNSTFISLGYAGAIQGIDSKVRIENTTFTGPFIIPDHPNREMAYANAISLTSSEGNAARSDLVLRQVRLEGYMLAVAYHGRRAEFEDVHVARCDTGVSIAVDTASVTRFSYHGEAQYASIGLFAETGSRVSVRDAVFSDNRGVGISLLEASLDAANLTMTNISTGIRLEYDYVPSFKPRVVVRNSSFTATKAYAIESRDPNADFDARFNYWGSDDGPLLGKTFLGRNGVSGDVALSPWLTAAGVIVEGEPEKSIPGMGAVGLLAAGALAFGLDRRNRR